MLFLIALLVCAMMIVAVSYLIFPVFPSFFFQTIILLFLGAAGIYYYLVDIKDEKPKYFAQLYLLSLSVKLIAYGAYILFVLLKSPNHAAANAGVFMATYILFTALEVGFLYRKISEKKSHK
ncbi:MAG TPA: hypothetical protein PKN99_07315 [Cyclobacteriaceae bacterium]|nr:hypothetical protein [Cyclobacteriaceae bacterium]